MSHFVIACGGTGGHLSPGIALAERLTGAGHRCWLVVSKKDIDKRLSAKYTQFEFVTISATALTGNPLQLPRFLWGQVSSLVATLRFLWRVKPDTVIGFGGFITAGVLLAASLYGCPLALHEANRRPGRSISLLRNLADRVYLPDGVSLRGVPPRVIKHLGLPVRQEIHRRSRESARRAIGMEVPGKLLVVLGGSQGAAALNDWIKENLEGLAAEEVNVYAILGPGKGAEGSMRLRAASGRTVQARFVSFVDRMGDVLSAADLVVARAGASTIAELTACAVPSILVPYPHAADRHQDANATFFEQQGGCVVKPQSQLHTLRREVAEMIFNDWLLGKVRENLRSLCRLNSAEAVSADLEKLAERYRSRRGAAGPAHPVPAR